VVPSFSVACLMGVTAWVTVKAVQTLTAPGPTDDDEDVNVYVLWGFSSLNMVVDLVSFYMFYSKGRQVFQNVSSSSMVQDKDQETAAFAAVSREKTEVLLPLSPESSSGEGASTTNLNMVSAFSHVGGDTLRTLSIFFAAAYATVTGTPGYLVDAWASAIVTVTIVIMIVPLLAEIGKAISRSSAME